MAALGSRDSVLGAGRMARGVEVRAPKGGGGNLRLGFALLLPLVVLLTGCMQYRAVQVEQLGRIGFSPDPQGQGLRLEIPLRVYNPNPYRITLLKGDFTFYFQSTELCRGELLSDTVSLLANRSEWVRIPLAIHFRSPGDELRLLWGGVDWKSALEVEGNLRAKVGIRRGGYRIKRTPIAELAL